MQIEQMNGDSKGYFKASSDGVEAGRMTYTWVGEVRFIIDHTEVDPAFKGQGVGRQLVMQAVNFARQNNLKIIPLCPYAKSVFDKTEDMRDVL